MSRCTASNVLVLWPGLVMVTLFCLKFVFSLVYFGSRVKWPIVSRAAHRWNETRGIEGLSWSQGWIWRYVWKRTCRCCARAGVWSSLLPFSWVNYINVRLLSVDASWLQCYHFNPFAKAHNGICRTVYTHLQYTQNPTTECGVGAGNCSRPVATTGSVQCLIFGIYWQDGFT